MDFSGEKMGIWPQKHDFNVFGVKCPFFQEGHPLFYFWIDLLFDLSSPLKKAKDITGEKMGIWP